MVIAFKSELVYENDCEVRAFPGRNTSQLAQRTFQEAIGYLKACALPNIKYSIEECKSGGLFSKKLTTALMIVAEFGAYTLRGTITVHVFGSIAVTSLYLLIEGESFTELFGKESDPKRDLILRKLKDLESMDFFSAVENTIRMVFEVAKQVEP